MYYSKNGCMRALRLVSHTRELMHTDKWPLNEIAHSHPQSGALHAVTAVRYCVHTV